MKSVIFLFLFIGIIMVIDGIYKDEIHKLKKRKQIEYRYVPRDMYEDMLYSQHTTPKYESIFTGEVDTRGAGRYV